MHLQKQKKIDDGQRQRIDDKQNELKRSKGTNFQL